MNLKDMKREKAGFLTRMICGILMTIVMACMVFLPSAYAAVESQAAINSAIEEITYFL